MNHESINRAYREDLEVAGHAAADKHLALWRQEAKAQNLAHLTFDAQGDVLYKGEPWWQEASDKFNPEQQTLLRNIYGWPQLRGAVLA